VAEKIAAAVPTAIGAKMTGSELVDRLVRNFGLGDKPLLRMALYNRLGDVVDEHGERALQIIATVIDDAKCRGDNESHYFAFVVMKRLQDRGLLPVNEKRTIESMLP